MERKEYNGWTNYETWLANLWMDNDQGSQEYWRERAENACDEATDRDEAIELLASELESDMDDRIEECVGAQGVLAEFLRTSADEVDWQDIARHWVDDTDHEWTADDEDAEEATDA